MKLPDKTTTYQKSVIAAFPPILSLLKERDMKVSELRQSLPGLDFGDYISALDCLYALRKIDLDRERGMLRYADTDHL